MSDKNIWTVYKHIGPTAKVYVGITSREPKLRWGHQGKGYQGCKRFWNAIQKYGWDAFRHEIVMTGLTHEEACQMEIELVEKYTEQNKTYNILVGGTGPTGPIPNKRLGPMSDEHKQKISQALKGRPHTPEHTEKVRQANIGKRLENIWINKDGEEKSITREEFYDYAVDGWQLGRAYRMSEKGKESISKHFTGRTLSDEHKKKLSKVGKGKLKNYIWITRDGKNKRVPDEKLLLFLTEGWTKGYKISAKLIWVTKDGIDRRIEQNVLQSYIENGWAEGRAWKAKSNNIAPKQTSQETLIWINNGQNAKRIPESERSFYPDWNDGHLSHKKKLK